MYVCMRPAKKQKQKQNDVLYMDEKKKKKSVYAVCAVCAVCVCGLATCMRWNLDLMMNCDLIRINQ